jgi:hypothetical protein
MEKMNDNEILTVMLSEYKTLRSELTTIFNRELQFFTILVSTLGIIYSIIFSQIIYDLIFFIPLIVYPLFLKYRYGTYSVKKMGEYLLELEEKIKQSFSDPSKQDQIKREGWQNRWENIENKNTAIKKYDILPKCILFFGIPIFVAWLYSLLATYFLFIKVDAINYTKLPNYVYPIIFLICSYLIYKTIKFFYYWDPDKNGELEGLLKYIISSDLE